MKTTLLFLFGCLPHLLFALPGFEATLEVRTAPPTLLRKPGYVYEYLSDTDSRGLALRVPLDAEVVRGVLIDGNAGVSDNRAAINQSGPSAFAERFDFAVAGTKDVSGGSTFSTHGEMIMDALDAFAELGVHPELANVPFISHGSSSGGGNAYGLAMYAPERCICFTANVLVGPNPVFPPSPGYLVPGIFTIGEVDPLVASNRVDTPRAMAAARAEGAPWAWVMIQGMGHEHRRVWRLYYPFWEEMIARRIPPSADPRNGPISLRPLVEDSGYLLDDESWEETIPFIAPANDYPRDPGTASWLPSRDMAYLMRGFAAWNTPLTLSIDGIPSYYNTQPARVDSFMDEFSPGQSITLRVDPGDFAWTRLEFFRGAEPVGEVTSGEPALSIILGYQSYAQSFTVVAHNAAGDQRTAILQGIHVYAPSDPHPEWIELPGFGWYAYPDAPWYYLLGHGWLWFEDTALHATSGTYFWSLQNSRWYWMRTSWLPWVYDHTSSTWINLDDESL